MAYETQNPTLEPRSIDWSEGRALSIARVDADASRAQQLGQIRDAIDADRLPDEAVDALIAAGWTELDD